MHTLVGNIASTTVEDVLPDLVGYQFRQAPSLPLTSRPISLPQNETLRPKLWSKGRRVLFSVLRSKKGSSLMALPPELLLLITTELSDVSRASLALACRGLLSFISDPSLFKGLGLPPEQPPEFQSPRMSKTRVYQPARWEFLRLLERDLNSKWYLCSECFTLHPRKMFAQYKNSTVPWLKNYYKLKDSDFRTCRHGRIDLCSMQRDYEAPSGIVDLCPCIKMTIGKKLQMEARLREDAVEAWKTHKDDRPAADFWWHECRHTYGEINVELKIGLFLYSGTKDPKYGIGYYTVDTNALNFPPRLGDLGALLEYRYTYPSTSSRTSSRLLCPHRNLDTIKDLLACSRTHPEPEMYCELCEDIQQCQYCCTKVLDFSEAENTATGKTCCSCRVERCFSNNVWLMHTVFPFARRQVPLQRRAPLLI